MSGGLTLVVAVPTALLLVCFSARRVVLLAAALATPRRGGEPTAPMPSVTLAVPARNEAEGIDRVLEAIDRIDYPSDSLSVVVVDDGSTDDTADRLTRWADGRPRAAMLSLERPSGRSGALNAALAAGPASDLFVACDADLRPHPDCLHRLAACFGDEEVGAAAAFLRPANCEAGPVARYAALETWTHQLVTSAGEDRLRLNPPLLGVSAYRRAALDSIGGLRPGGPGDDVHATAALTRQGWRTRFVADAVADNTVVAGWRAYWRQHIRWGRNLFTAGRGETAAPERPSSRRPSVARRLESLAARTGYADRIVFGAALVLAALGVLSPWFPAGYLAVVVGEALAATVKAGASRQAHLYLAAAVALFPLDVIASLAAALAHLARRPGSRRGAWREPGQSAGR